MKFRGREINVWHLTGAIVLLASLMFGISLLVSRIPYVREPSVVTTTELAQMENRLAQQNTAERNIMFDTLFRQNRAQQVIITNQGSYIRSLLDSFYSIQLNNEKNIESISTYSNDRIIDAYAEYVRTR